VECPSHQLELENFVRIFGLLQPPSPSARIGSIEIYGQSCFLNGSAGGDHIIFVDFAHRYDLDRRIAIASKAGDIEIAQELAENRRRIGVLLADVSGHSMTDALVAAMLHQAFLTGVLYELDTSGQVSTRLFENLNTRFYKSVSFEKYITLIYGEISEQGTFRFLSAGHPAPMIFSAEFDRFVTISADRLRSFYPLGMFPSEDDIDASRNPPPLLYKESYSVNEVNLMGAGDILLLFTDGLAGHEHRDEAYIPGRLEALLRSVKHQSAKQIFEAIRDDAVAFAPPEDDLSLVVIRRSP
jgi:serine phosphatase RsbU (regulator of sigma subunit)